MQNNFRKRDIAKLSGVFLSCVFVAAVLVMALIIILNSSLGWFAANETVSGNNMSIQLSNEAIELAVSGAQVSNYADDAAIITYLSDPANGGYQKLASTDSANPSIICKMVDETPNPPEVGKIAPGSYGYVNFDLVVKTDATAIEFDLDFIALDVNNSGTPTAINAADADLVDLLLTGHILFFKERTSADNGYYYSGELANDTYIYTLADHTADKSVESDGDHYEINLFWVWPREYAQMAYPKGHVYQRMHALFASDSASAAERADLIADMAAHPTKYFYEYNNESATVDFTDPDFATLYYVNLTDGYNNADQFIGDRVHYLVVRITANIYE